MEPADGVDERPAQYLLVYSAREAQVPWWARWVDRELAHVEIWWEIGDGYYSAVRPYYHYLVTEIMHGAPNGRVQSVLAQRLDDSVMFPAGMKTCVSVAKAMLGIRSPWVLTPRQLYNYVERRNGVV